MRVFLSKAGPLDEKGATLSHLVGWALTQKLCSQPEPTESAGQTSQL